MHRLGKMSYILETFQTLSKNELDIKRMQLILNLSLPGLPGDAEKCRTFQNQLSRTISSGTVPTSPVNSRAVVIPTHRERGDLADQATDGQRATPVCVPAGREPAVVRERPRQPNCGAQGWWEGRGA